LTRTGRTDAPRRLPYLAPLALLALLSLAPPSPHARRDRAGGSAAEHRRWGYRRRLLLAELEGYAPDVLCLQEVLSLTHSLSLSLPPSLSLSLSLSLSTSPSLPLSLSLSLALSDTHRIGTQKTYALEMASGVFAATIASGVSGPGTPPQPPGGPGHGTTDRGPRTGDQGTTDRGPRTGDHGQGPRTGDHGQWVSSRAGGVVVTPDTDGLAAPRR
jgi:hypothetical protein